MTKQFEYRLHERTVTCLSDAGKVLTGELPGGSGPQNSPTVDLRVLEKRNQVQAHFHTLPPLASSASC